MSNDLETLTCQVDEALAAGDTDAALVLLEGNDELLHLTTYFGTWLHVAAKTGQLCLVKRLIELGLDVNAEAKLGGTPLCMAAHKGHVDVVKQLIDSGADVNPGSPNRNAMFSAVYMAQKPVVHALIESGFDQHIVYRSIHGHLKNAISFATEQGATDIVGLLQDAGCKMPVEGVDIAVNELMNSSSETESAHSEIIEGMAAQFGPVEALALHEIVPVDDEIRVSVNVIRPNEKSGYLTIFTTGMSDRPMTVPTGQEDYKYAELVMFLPASWTIPTRNDSDKSSLWPFQWLRNIAYYPHQADTWLGGPHTIIASDDPPVPLGPGTKQTCLLLAADYAQWSPMALDDGRTIHFYTVMPIFTDERDFEMAHGVDSLIERFQTRGVTPIVWLDRPSVADDA